MSSNHDYPANAERQVQRQQRKGIIIGLVPVRRGMSDNLIIGALAPSVNESLSSLLSAPEALWLNPDPT